MYPGRAPSIQNRLRVKHDIHCRQLQKYTPLSCFIHIIVMAQLLLGILVVIIIIIIVFVIVIIVIVIIVIIIIIIIIIIITIIIIFIIIVIIIQVGRLFSANCVVNVVQEYRIAKPARSHTSHFIFFLFFTVNQDNNFTDFSRST